MSQSKSHYIDLNDYDLGPEKEGKYQCPVCNEQSLSFKRSNGQVFTCWKGCKPIDIRRALKPHNEVISDELQAKREAAAQRRIEEERLRVAALKTTAERNADWQKILEQSILSDRHRKDMLDRGHTDESIERSGARSLANGRYMPVRDFAGNIVNAQRADKGAKFWYGESGTNNLKETLELPLSIVYPSGSPKFDKKEGGYIAYTESTGDKPWIFSTQSKCVVIGSSNIGSQPIDLKRSIEGIAAKYGWEKTYHVLMPDAGMLSNSGVMGNYARLHTQLAELGHELHVGWWGQYEKLIGDIDEISVDKEVKIISWDEYLKLAEDYREYKTLTTLTVDNRYVEKVIYSEKYVKPFAPVPSTITLVSSPCATGKTEVLKALIDQYIAKYEKARIINITHLNTLREGIQERLNIDDWRTGFKQEDAALNSFQKISVCLDSLLKLAIESIPRNSLLILDELEAMLQHVAQGGTLSGSRKTQTQRHLAAIIERVLITGGSVIGLEDGLTDCSVELLHKLSGSQYDRILIKNDFQPEPWKVSMGQGKVDAWLMEIINRLQAGERLFVPNTSQEFGEALERLVLLLLPEFSEKTVRLDRKTTSKHQDLMRDPVKYLTADRDVRLFICSPTIQSGFNIALWGYFKAVMMRASNLSTRAIIQMLNRVRDNCERLIFTKMRGVGANTARSVEKLKEQQKLLANEMSLAHGYGRISETLETIIWNHAGAQFEVRDNLSTCYLHHYLYLNLAERGHEMSEPNWLGATGWDDIDDKFKEIKQQIKIDDNKILFDADGHKLSLVQARNILGSSNQPWELQQQARKTILQARAAMQFLSEEALMVLWTADKGLYWKQCEFAWLMLNPEVARVLDRQEMHEKQGSHQIYRDAPTTSAKVDLLQPIKDDLLDLASGRDYDKNDPAVARINAWCLRNSFQAYKFFKINFNSEIVDSHGCVRNTAIANVNKVLRVIGFKPKSTRQVGSKKDRIYIYQVENAGCEHRELVNRAMAITHKETIEKDENIQSAKQTITALVELPVEEARSVVVEFKKYGQWNAKTMRVAAALLDAESQTKWRAIAA